MRTRWFFVLDDGLEPSEIFGPTTTDEAEVRAIITAMRAHPELADPEGSACLYRIEVDDAGTPHVGAYSRNFMNRCRRSARR